MRTLLQLSACLNGLDISLRSGFTYNWFKSFYFQSLTEALSKKSKVLKLTGTGQKFTLCQVRRDNWQAFLAQLNDFNESIITNEHLWIITDKIVQTILSIFASSLRQYVLLRSFWLSLLEIELSNYELTLLLRF